jgi:predicted RNA-binding protein YlxR (DUF448 family)
VRGPDGAAGFDLEGRLPGRGAWVCPAPACLDRLSAGALGHVLRAPVQLPGAAERRAALADALARRVANTLTMARKARGVSFGADSARALLAAGRAHLLLTSAALPPDAAAAWAGRAGAVPVRSAPDAAALGALLGTRPVEVAAVTADGLARALVRAIDRWQTFASDSCNNENSGTHRATRPAKGGPRREEAEGL